MGHKKAMTRYTVTKNGIASLCWSDQDLRVFDRAEVVPLTVALTLLSWRILASSLLSRRHSLRSIQKIILNYKKEADDLKFGIKITTE
jgi:hypothetical protein